MKFRKLNYKKIGEGKFEAAEKVEQWFRKIENLKIFFQILYFYFIKSFNMI